MSAGQITWERFITSNNDARGVRYKFEDLSRQLFTYEFLSHNLLCKYVHSNPIQVLTRLLDYLDYYAHIYTKDCEKGIHT